MGGCTKKRRRSAVKGSTSAKERKRKNEPLKLMNDKLAPYELMSLTFNELPVAFPTLFIRLRP